MRRRLQQLYNTASEYIINAAGYSDLDKKVVFILGCQRSGTTLLAMLLNASSYVSLYDESINNVANNNFRLRDESTIKSLIERDWHKVLVFKALNDNQYAGNLLEYYGDTQGLWIYRCYQDTVNSAVVKWKDTQKKYMQWIGGRESTNITHFRPANDLEKRSAIYIERMDSQTHQVIKEHVDDDLTPEEGAALLWYARNQMYFDMGLHKDNRVLLVSYEDMVTHPDERIARIYNFIGIPMQKRILRDIKRTSIGKKPAPPLRKHIASLCEELMTRLDNQYQQQLARGG